MADESGKEENIPSQKSVSRRVFLKGLGGGAALLVAAEAARRSGLKWLFEAEERPVDSLVIEKEKKDDMGLGPDRAEHFTLWPYSRVWVVVNNLIAAKKLDGLTFEKGKEYSLIDLLNLEKDYKRNIDPQKATSVV